MNENALFDAALNGRSDDLVAVIREIIQSRSWDRLDEAHRGLLFHVTSLLRRSMRKELEPFAKTLFMLTQDEDGDLLAEMAPSLAVKWECLFELVDTALENYHEPSAERFVQGRTHAQPLMEALSRTEDEVPNSVLLEKLNISKESLSRLLREFEKRHLLTRRRQNRKVWVQLTLTGRALAEKLGWLASPQTSHEMAAHGPPRKVLSTLAGCG